jgi:DNA-binding transcriptional LysR family regulator
MVSNRRTLPLLGLRDFEAAARGGSFSAAAMELGVTPGAISQQVKLLEDRMGVRLFERRPQSLILTEAGKTLLPLLTGALDSIEGAVARLSLAQGSVALTLAMPAIFAFGWFLPRMRTFHESYRRFELIPRSSGHLLQPDIEGVNAAFRYGRAGWGRLGCIFLFVDALVPLCSPQYLLGAGPADRTMAGHTLLVSETSPDIWSRWRQHTAMGGGAENVMMFGDDTLVVQAAINGLGVALLDRNLLSGFLRDGQLVSLLDVPAWKRGSGWYLVFDESRRDDEGLTAVIDWLIAETGLARS